MVDHDSPTPVYVQIADVMAGRIADGTLRPGKPIPSEAHMGQEFGVARETVRRAVALLRERGLVFTVAHRGTYVGQPDSE